MTQIFLKPDKDKLPRKRHAWIFSGAIARVQGQPQAGDVVEVLDHQGQFLAQGHWNPTSQIRVRLLEWNPQTVIHKEFWKNRLVRAVELRKVLGRGTLSGAGRLVFSEGDSLPGLILDHYGSLGVIQLLTSGMEALRDTWVEIIRETLPEITGLYEKSDGDGRAQEGLADRRGWLIPPDASVTLEKPIEVAGLRFLVDLEGQKTGFYTDQHLNRLRAEAYAPGRTCADVFCFSGGFASHLLKAGARSVVLTDASQDALTLAQENLKLNGFPPQEAVCGDAFSVLRDWKREGRRFGLIVLDPPKLVTSRGGLEKGLKAYKDLNLQALHLLEPGGILLSFSCSGLVSRSDFLQTVNFAVKDAGRTAQILEHLSQAPDHPVLTTHPEGEYLKGVILRVL